MNSNHRNPIGCFCTRKRVHFGFTLVELLVVFAIIAILVGLTSMAVQAAREAARRVDCSNRLRQIGVAMQNHLSSKRTFPGNGGYEPLSSIVSSTGSRVIISTYDNQIGSDFQWGVGAPGASPQKQTGSWAYAILPYMEQSNAYEHIDFRTIQSGFLCPTRSRPLPVATIDDTYGRYESGGWSWAKTDFAANFLVVPNLPRVFSPSSITDGLSNTLLVGEKAYDRLIHTSSTWFWDEPIFSGGSQGTARDGFALVPDGDRYEFKHNWGSAHSGVHFLQCDSSVELVPFDVDWLVFAARRTPNKAD